MRWFLDFLLLLQNVPDVRSLPPGDVPLVVEAVPESLSRVVVLPLPWAPRSIVADKRSPQWRVPDLASSSFSCF
jgi:hypothetical protein